MIQRRRRGKPRPTCGDHAHPGRRPTLRRSCPGSVTNAAHSHNPCLPIIRRGDRPGTSPEACAHRRGAFRSSIRGRGLGRASLAGFCGDDGLRALARQRRGGGTVLNQYQSTGKTGMIALQAITPLHRLLNRFAVTIRRSTAAQFDSRQSGTTWQDVDPCLQVADRSEDVFEGW